MSDQRGVLDVMRNPYHQPCTTTAEIFEYTFLACQELQYERCTTIRSYITFATLTIAFADYYLHKKKHKQYEVGADSIKHWKEAYTNLRTSMSE